MTEDSHSSYDFPSKEQFTVQAEQPHHSDLNQNESFFSSLYNSLSQFYKTPAKDFTACLRRATQITAFSARKQTRKSMMMM